MATCASCGKQILAGRGEVGFRSKGKAYHLSCAPAGLLNSAIDEWDAILSRGVAYFVGKYVLPEVLKGKSGTATIGRFAKIGEKLKAEAKGRRGRAD